MSEMGQDRRFDLQTVMSGLPRIVLQNPVVLSAIVAWSFGVLPCSALPLRGCEHQGITQAGQGNC